MCYLGKKRITCTQGMCMCKIISTSNVEIGCSWLVSITMTAEPFIVVIGATGQQGGGCVDALLQQGKFAVKAVTRNENSQAAKSLKERNVDVVTADLNDKESLVKVSVLTVGVAIATAALATDMHAIWHAGL